MLQIRLRKLKLSDKHYFARWWRNKELLQLTTGILRLISDSEVDMYFSKMLNGHDRHFIITAHKKTIGHIALIKRKNQWHEIRIIIGEKIYWNRGYGTKAIGLLLKKAKYQGISKIYLEVKPNNVRAIAVYNKCGFQKSGITDYPLNPYLLKILRMEIKI